MYERHKRKKNYVFGESPEITYVEGSAQLRNLDN